MKHQTTSFKSLELALKELGPFIRDGEHLQTGKPFKSFSGLRSRELLANWLLCVAVNSLYPDRFTFTSDPLGGDGIICDKARGETSPTEHVLVPNRGGANTTDSGVLILNAIRKKHDKGDAAYASGKTLVVFLNSGGGEWYPNRVARQLPSPLHFEAVWVVGLQSVEETGQYIYAVTRLDVSHGNAPAWRVRIAKDFNAWQVEIIQ